jgi:hypothetical protein
MLLRSGSFMVEDKATSYIPYKSYSKTHAVLMASLAQARAEAGVVAKADQHYYSFTVMYFILIYSRYKRLGGL